MFIFEGVTFDDSNIDDEGAEWSQICNNCLIKYGFKQENIDMYSGSGI